MQIRPPINPFIMRKFLFIITILSVLVLAGCTTVTKGSSVSVAPPAHDFGDIVQSKGVVTTTFAVKNTGNEPLVINRLSTSCGCTTAEMDESPLQPNESRKMVVTFDPMVHPDQLGKIERVVYLQTSDPIQPEVEIDITGNVIK